MTTFLHILFWVSLGWLAIVFFLYPLGMAIAAALRKREINKSENGRPTIALIMAAYNEEAVIRRRLQNYLDLDYPRDLLSFYVGSDGSVDKTDEIIKSFVEKDSSIHFRRFNRSGKTKIVYTLAEEADADILVFGDADVVYSTDSLKKLTSCFGDPSVGGVVVQVRYEDDEENIGNVGEKTYHGLEDRIRRHESLVHSTIGPTGQFFAVRRGAYTPLTDYRMSDDLNLAISVALNGYRVWYEPEIVVTEVNKRTLWTETGRRMRMGRQSMATFLKYDGTKWPWRSLVGFQIWSHKILRNLAAIPALLLYCSSIFLRNEWIGYEIVFIAGTIWFGLVALGALIEVTRIRLPLLGYPLYLTMMLVALTLGSIRAMYGSGLEMWTSPRLQQTEH